jgi:hypothetical protein
MKKQGFFWVGYSDLMTTLFFVMLVLYVISFTLYKKQVADINKKNKKLEKVINDLDATNQELNKTKKKLLIEAEKGKIIDIVEENLKPLKENTYLFKYEPSYKRFTLAFDVKFKIGEVKLKNDKIENYSTTIKKINSAGHELKNIIDNLARNKITNPKLKDVSYLVIIAGYASHLPGNNQYTEFERSYKRAYYLWEYWKQKGIDFEDEKFKGLIDLQIAGNGWGGIGRFPLSSVNDYVSEKKNQRFIIQIVPKIGEIN